MDKKYLLYVTIIISAIIIINVTTAADKGIKTISQKQKIVNGFKESGQIKKADSSSIIFVIPPVKCGSISWKDPIISNWLAKYCADKCSDSVSSGYKFSGRISNSDKSCSLKVIIKTDGEYAQPVRFNPDNGTFDGKVYFDKSNRMDTHIKVMLRDSNNITLQTFVIALTE